MRKIIGAFFFLVVTLTYGVDKHPMSYDIPGGIAPEKTPMFVCFGWDDNAYTDAMVWSDTLFADKKNKDGSPARGTYFITAGFASDHFRDVGEQTRQSLKASWKSVYDQGHEIANHTFSHPNGGTKVAGDGSAGQNYSKEEWEAEMQQCMDSLSAIMGISQDEILGFRTPYLGVNQGDFDAQKAMGIKYDCSIEYGYGQGYADNKVEGGSNWNSMSKPETRKKLFWPFTLENGWSHPHPDIDVENMYAPDIKAPGQWMFTVYTYLEPPSVGTGEVTGFDGNMWTSGMSKNDFYETLKYNFDLQRAGNKCPMIVNTHTDNYSEWSPGNFGQYKYDENWQNRREAIEMFLDYVLQFDDVRVVPFKDVIDWINNPVPLAGETGVAEVDEIISPIATLDFTDNGAFYLNFNKDSRVTVTLSDIRGRKIADLHSGDISGANRFDLTGLGLAIGTYLIHVNGDISMAKKFKIQ